MTNQEKLKYIERFMSTLDDFENNYQRRSTFNLALKGARDFSGRNIHNGFYEKREINEYNFENRLLDTKYFNSLLLYFIVHEQIGSLFNHNTIIAGYDGIRKALLTYTNNLTEKEINAIYSLRNSLAHRFGLATEINNKKSFKF
ncbi:MAG: hypothetical protein ACWIPI_10645 [Polaribacter sp.]